MKLVRFPMYFEVCGYQELVLPDNINTDDEDEVKNFISDNWDYIKLPGEYEYVGDTGFDFESEIEIFTIGDNYDKE